jgi:hypothetical protein
MLGENTTGKGAPPACRVDAKQRRRVHAAFRQKVEKIAGAVNSLNV